MKIELEHVLPGEIEKRSFEILSEELGDRKFSAVEEPIIKRVIHTTADFDYADHLCFSPGVVEQAQQALKKGAWIVTDTNMVQAGIHKKTLEQFGGKAVCHMAEEAAALLAKANGTTRAAACVELAIKLEVPFLYAVGNAPTALIRLYELILEGKIRPAAIIGVPVGFVNVVQAKELIMQTDIPYIVARGRKGGSNVAAAICNALLYEIKNS